MVFSLNNFEKEYTKHYTLYFHFLMLVHFVCKHLFDYINFNKKNKEITINASREFEDKTNFLNDLRALINNHIGSHIVISYRNNGIPSIEEISDLLREFDVFEVLEYNLGKYNYALNKNNNLNEEILFVCTNIRNN